MKREMHRQIERFDQLRGQVDPFNVELEVADETGASRMDAIGLCLRRRVGAIEIQAPAAGRWLGGRVHPCLDDTPEVVERRCPGEHSSESDDGDRLGHGGYAFVCALSSSRL